MRFDVNGERLLLGLYLALALAFLFVTGEPAQRSWAQIAVVGYALAFVVALLRWGRGWAALIAFTGSVVVPLVVLVVLGRGQPEVTVIRDGAQHLLSVGTPYLVDPASLYEFRPYFPGMFLFGIFPGVLGDVRVLGSGLLLVAVLVQFDERASLFAHPATDVVWPRVGLLFACPVVALALAGSGVDAPQAALTLLAIAALKRRWWISAGLAAGCAVALKPVGLAALFVLVVAAYRRGGLAGAGRVLSAAVGVSLLVVGPIAAVDFHGFVMNTIGFPAGSTRIKSPASSPFPGVLLREAGAPGWASSALVVGAAAAYAIYSARARMQNARGVAAVIAGGFVVAFAVVPYSRFGYLMLPALVWFTVAITEKRRGAPPATLLPPS